MRVTLAHRAAAGGQQTRASAPAARTVSLTRQLELVVGVLTVYQRSAAPVSGVRARGAVRPSG